VVKATTTKFAAAMEALEAPPTIEELKAKAKEIYSEVRAVLGERLTPESLSRGILYKAARARVISEKNFLALKCVDEMLEVQHRDLLHGVELRSAADKAREELDSYALPLAKRGAQFTGNKRPLSLLYREALAILESEGIDLPSKRVRLALEKAGVIRDDSGLLRWTDDAGRQKETSWKQFDTSLSRHRARIR